MTPFDEIIFQTTRVQNTWGISFNISILQSHQLKNYVYTVLTQQDSIIIAFALGKEQEVRSWEYSDKP